MGDIVAAWKAHAVADHNEAVTVTLPPKMRHAYCWLQASYYHINFRHIGIERCSFRTASILCQRAARHAGLRWKRHAHAPQTPAPQTESPPSDSISQSLSDSLDLEAQCDFEKQSIIRYMVWLKSGASRQDRYAWYKQYLLDHHADKHPEWTMTEIIIRQVALCDFVKRARPWFLMR